MTDPIEQLRAGLEGRYAIENELGRGGMAVVYRARDLRHERAVAIKVLRPEIASAVGAERFVREIQIVSSLQHPHILPLHDSGTVGEIPYYVMPLVEGETLRRRIDREGQLPLDDALRIAREIGEALHYAHERGLIHRDVKPENVLLSSGHAMVADFGIAHAISRAGPERLTETGVAMGTPAYMSPEQGAGETHLDARSDVYSLGCVLYEMLVGEPPFGGRTAQAVIARHLQEHAPSIEVVRPTVPPPVIATVERALAKTPADRFATAADFCRALGADTTAATAARSRPATRRRLGALTLSLLGAGAAALAGWLWLRPRPPLNPNRVIVFPLQERSLGVADAGAGLDVAIAVGVYLEGTDPLKWIDGWPLLEPELRADVGAMSARAARAISRARGARYYVDGVIQGSPESVTVSLRLLDAAGDSVVTRASAGAPVGAVPPYRLGLMATRRLLPALIDPAAVPDTGSLMQRDPAAVALFIQGERAYRATDFTTAMDFYRRALVRDSLLVFAAVRAAQAAGWQHRPREVRELFSVAVQHDSLLPPRYRYLARGLAASFAGLADTAVSWLARSLAEDSGWTAAHMALGEVYHHLLPSAQDSLPMLAQREFETVLRADSAFAPALYHAAQYAVLRGDLPAARAMLERLRAAGGDSVLVGELALAEACVRDGADGVDWTAGPREHVLPASALLAVGGAHPRCAEAGFLSAYRAPDATVSQRWGALIGLQGVLAMEGRWGELRALLDSAVARGLSQGLLLYMLDAFAGAPVDLAAARGEQYARELFGPGYAGAGSQTLWFVGSWFVHLGDLGRARAVLDSLAAKAALATTPGPPLLRDALAAQVRLASGDTAAAVVELQRLAPVVTAEVLQWDLVAPLVVERLRLARALAARGDYAGAHRVAASFDGPPLAHLPFLAASLRIRMDAAERLRRSDLAEAYGARLRALEPQGGASSQ